jgi:uncharacterized protein
MQVWPNFHAPLIDLLLGFVSVSLSIYALCCIALSKWQKQLIFFPSSVIKNTPSNLGLAYDEVWVPVSSWNGKTERLYGWWIPAASAKSDVLLYLHGNSGNISTNLGHAKRFHQLGFSLLLVDYRGFGRSRGQFPSESEMYRDAQAAWDYLVRQREIQPREIFIYGHSLGGAIAIDLAVRRPQTAGLIVENTFTTMRDLLTRQGIFKLFPARNIITERFDSLNKLKLLRVPLFVIHGRRNRTIPPKMGQSLYEAATVPKKFLIVPHAGHNNLAIVNQEEYLHAMGEFYQQVRQNQLSAIG